MIARVQKWGNSLALRIPLSFAREAHVAENTEVNLKVERGRLVVEAIKTPVFRLADLLAGVSRQNIHEAVETGDPVGRELL